MTRWTPKPRAAVDLDGNPVEMAPQPPVIVTRKALPMPPTHPLASLFAFIASKEADGCTGHDTCAFLVAQGRRQKSAERWLNVLVRRGFLEERTRGVMEKLWRFCRVLPDGWAAIGELPAEGPTDA